jgi:hypothetical protein
MTGFRLSVRARKVWLVVHVIVSVALIGVTGAVLGLSAMAASQADAHDAHVLFRATYTIALAGAIPLSLLALTTGLVLGLGTQWGLVRHGWVTVKLAAVVRIMLVGSLIVGPSLDHAIRHTRSGAGSPELGATLALLTVAAVVNLALAAIAVTLGVFKPRVTIWPFRPPGFVVP